MEHCTSKKEKNCCHEHVKQDEYHHEHENWQEMKANYFLELADEAWEEILKDKIKEYILKTQNERMDNLAKVVAEGNAKRWKNRMEEKA